MMKLTAAFFRLIRWPNLLFIVLTQVLFYSCVYLPLYGTPQHQKIGLLIVASVLIAAAGYIINDYFDLNIDQINKPEKNVLVRTISRRWAILWHLLLNICGVTLTFLAVGFSHWYLVVANVSCAVLLWLYSTSLKKMMVVGNVVISLLTAWTVLVVFFAFTQAGDAFRSHPAAIKFFRVAFLYAGFAFIISLVREAVKDMEDLEGDSRYGCRTLPIVAGIRTTKVYIFIWVVVLIAMIIVVQLYVLLFGWWPSVLYLLLAVLLPLLSLAGRLFKATSIQDFAQLSRLSKWIMLTGILSMIFFRFYF
jgi:4-hydroxybenzoate polyprenyltransferase